MPNLLSSLLSSAGSLRTFEKALSVTQNNVANASTPGFAKQRLSLLAQPFNPDIGLPGVHSGPVMSSRSVYAEKNVWRAQEYAGFYSQREAALAQLEPVFDLGPGSGLSGAFSRFFQSFSALAVSPSDPAAREVVIGRAESVAESFQVTARGVGDAKALTVQGIEDVAREINRLGGALRDLNVERRRGGDALTDPSIDAQYSTTLEELAELVDYTALPQADGTYSVLLGGEEPLVIGDVLHEIKADTSGVPARILDFNDQDITTELERGRLSSLLDAANRLIPSFEADLNSLAKEFADRVNTMLAAGLDASGQPPAVDLFTYAPSGEAQSIAVTGIQPSQIAAAAAGAPGGNGTALAIAGLGNAPNSPALGGQTFTAFYGGIAGKVGRELGAARESADRQESLVTQARSMRADITAVSLDEEAAHLMQFQRAYQASAQMVTVLNELTETMLGLLR